MPLGVTIQQYDGSSLVSEEVIFDDFFNTNSITVPFTINAEVTEDNYKILLETDQLRDWHKPNTEWVAEYN